MDLALFIVLGTVLYSVVYLIALCFLDCDFALKWAELFGQPIDGLRGKVVWVTGSSSGIGEHLAIALARRGVRLVLSARRGEELQRVKKRCLEVGDGLTDVDVLVLPLDVLATETHEARFRDVVNHFGELDVLVNNAGRSQRAVWEETETSVDEAMFRLNVFGVVSLTRLAVRYFATRGTAGGHVAVTSSIAGVLGVPFSGTYTATKWAMHGYYNSLRSEKMGSPLAVTILCPGPTFTNFLQESFTGRPGEKYGTPVSVGDRRMTGERCGELFATALANRLGEVWVGLFPILPLCYLMVYFPNAGKIVASFMGQKQFQKLRDTKSAMKSD